ncbi:MAG: sulfotransferase [Alphaproteobacteria bacterium]|nr:sulfotransferase [Alphaproteobacteria bacterium]
MPEPAAEPRQTPTIDPAHVLQRATQLHQRGRLAEAEGLYQEVLHSDPRSFEALHNAGLIRLQSGDYGAAIRLIQRALAVNPQSVEAYNNLGGALQALNRQEESLAYYQRALAINPNFADGHNNLGAALKALGRMEEALAAFERAVALAPDRAAFYRNLVDTRPVTADDPCLERMQRLAERMQRMNEEGQTQLHFALAKAYSDIGQHERSFRHLVAGNALKRRNVAYDEGNTLGAFARTRRVFTPELMQAKSGMGHHSPLPVFILGMPRSGTTLVEQILASHPAVFGAGELLDFEALVNNLPGRFPDVAAGLQQTHLTQFGERYAKRLAAIAPAARRVTDKMPANFRFAGLIHLALPGARIIHTRRDPVDTCLSCFSILFMGSQPHTYNLGELGRYYRAYDRLMAHWRAVLPQGVMLEVQYEDLVGNLEGQARRMLAHCGLDWDPACLDFHKTERPIRTASALQVRVPIYRSSVRRWRPAEQTLFPLLDGLMTPRLDS